MSFIQRIQKLFFVFITLLSFELALAQNHGPETDLQPEELRVHFGVDTENNLSVHNLPRILQIVREIFTQPSKVKIISKALEDLLIIDPKSLADSKGLEQAELQSFKVLTKEEFARRKAGELIEGITHLEMREKKIISEARFIKLLRQNSRIWKSLEEFIELYPRDSEELAKARQLKIIWRRNFQELHYRSEQATKDLKEIETQLKRLAKNRSTPRDKGSNSTELNGKKLELAKRIKTLDSELKREAKKEKDLQNNSNKIWKALRAVDDKLFKELFADRLRATLDAARKRKGFIRDNIATKPVALFLTKAEQAKGKLGYQLIDFRSTNDLIFDDGTFKKGENLEPMLIDFIDGAKKTLSMNFYEFDLPKTADAFIRAHRRGVKVRLSFDLEAMRHKSERMELYYYLRDYSRSVDAHINGSFHLSLIDSVSRNHQKIGQRDFQSKTGAHVFSGSANATYSGMSGDLAGSELEHDRAIANANKAYVFQSYAMANVVEHNLIKTQIYRLRGTSGINAYPKSGAFLTRGRGGDFVILAFTPNGGDGNVHEAMTAKAIRSSHGALYVMQFSASSQAILDAIAQRARKELVLSSKWELKAIVDPSSFVTDWSIFVKMAGMFRVPKNKVKESKAVFKLDPESAWRDLLGEQFERIMGDIRSAPSTYGMFYVEDENGNRFVDEKGKPLLLSAKYHHKDFITGKAFQVKKKSKAPYVVVTGSTNSSYSALKNQEQHFVIRDSEFGDYMKATFNGVWNQTNSEKSSILPTMDRANAQVLEELGGGKKKSKDYRKTLKTKSAKTCSKIFDAAS